MATYNGLTAAQRANLLNVARDTWKFYGADVDQATSLPMDNLTFAGGSAAPTTYGRYTSAANIGVYLWAVVSARDLGLITERQADTRVAATLTEVSHLQRYDGFLYQWYDTTNGQVLTNPGAADCPAGAAAAFNNCFFVSNVDNGWYASGLIVVGQAMPELEPLADRLIAPMNFGIFYDNRAETHCNTNPAIAWQPADRPDVRRLLRRPAAVCGQRPVALLPQRRVLQRPADLRLHRHGPAPDARQRLVAKLA